MRPYVSTKKARYSPLVFTLLLFILAGGIPTPAGRAATEVDPLFRDFYGRHQGLRVLGNPVGGRTSIAGFLAQYFEKGRIEDHRSETANPSWEFLYGRLVPEMMDRNPSGAVSGTDIRYSDLRAKHDAGLRWAVPNGYRAGTTLMTKEGVFVPFDPALRAVPGYKVPDFFWRYINQASLFPGGWLHDIGLSITEAFPATVIKNGARRDIIMQAFERTVLSYDPQNPLAWQIERANIGWDALPYHASGDDPIAIPATGERVAVPLHIMARVGKPGDKVTTTVTWPSGDVLTDTFTLLRGEDGNGLLIDDIDWESEGPPPQPFTGAALLRILGVGGVVLAQKQVEVLHWNDPGLVPVTLYWTDQDKLVAVKRSVPKTTSVAKVALEELLWGPGPRNTGMAGFGTALPMPQDVLSYPGRRADWGPRVTLRKLTITNGVATADFSDELRAYGGGSLRVTLIREQITRTLKEFPSVNEVVISIEGRTEGVLEP
jgi:hypothetical protein